MFGLKLDVIEWIKDICGSCILSDTQKAKGFAILFDMIPRELHLNLIVAILHFYRYRSAHVNAWELEVCCQVSDEDISLELESEWGDRLKKNVFEAWKLDRRWVEMVDVVIFFIDDGSSTVRNAAVFAYFLSFSREQDSG